LFVLSPNNPDAARHFCTIAREVLTSLLDIAAPDSSVLASNPKVTGPVEGHRCGLRKSDTSWRADSVIVEVTVAVTVEAVCVPGAAQPIDTTRRPETPTTTARFMPRSASHSVVAHEWSARDRPARLKANRGEVLV
jgi:hypothetical protein